MKRITEFAKAYPKYSLIAGALLLVALAASVVLIRAAWHTRSVEKQDAKIQQQIDKHGDAAETTETNANTHRDSRQSAEGRASLANEQREQARTNSSRTLEPLRKARQKHEEARRSRPTDYPDMSDDELCAELAKRGIACR